MSADDSTEKTPLEKLQDEYGSTLAGIHSLERLKQALYILNSVTDDELGESLEKFETIPAKGSPGSDNYRPAVTADSIIAQSQAPFTAMAEVLDRYIREVITETGDSDSD